MEPRSGFNPAKKQRVYVRSRSQTRQDKAGRVFGRVWNQTEPNCQSILGPLAGYPDPLLSVISSLHATCHTVCNEPPAQAKDFQVMVDSGKDMTCTKHIMAVSNVPPSAVSRARVVISRSTESASWATGKSSSLLANIFQLNLTTWTYNLRTRETPHEHPDKKVLTVSGTA